MMMSFERFGFQREGETFHQALPRLEHLEQVDRLALVILHERQCLNHLVTRRVHDLRHTFAVHFLKRRRTLNFLQRNHRSSKPLNNLNLCMGQ